MLFWQGNIIHDMLIFFKRFPDNSRAFVTNELPVPIVRNFQIKPAAGGNLFSLLNGKEFQVSSNMVKMSSLFVI